MILKYNKFLMESFNTPMAIIWSEETEKYFEGSFIIDNNKYHITITNIDKKYNFWQFNFFLLKGRELLTNNEDKKKINTNKVFSTLIKAVNYFDKKINPNALQFVYEKTSENEDIPKERISLGLINRYGWKHKHYYKNNDVFLFAYRDEKYLRIIDKIIKPGKFK